MPHPPARKKVLVIGPDQSIALQLHQKIASDDIITAEHYAHALDALRLHQPNVVIHNAPALTSKASTTSALLCIKAIKRLSPDTKILALVEDLTSTYANDLVAIGIDDILPRSLNDKALNDETLIYSVLSARRMSDLEHKLNLSDTHQPTTLDGVIARDPEMLKICRMLEKIAPANVSLTLTGESGTGKEVLTKALHQLSGRSQHRLVAINCAAVPEHLMEAELFGYEKGAFTGAIKRTLGKVEVANGGTLFLDEIGDMPLLLQTKLLRFLQERVIERVGGREEIPIDVRVVCATNKDLLSMIAEGTFREDLYYRITEMRLHIPPLRERVGDKLLLARHFLRLHRQIIQASGQPTKQKPQGKNTQHEPTSANNLPVHKLTADAISAIDQYGWPGNIREMENRIKRAIVMSDGRNITREDLGLEGIGEAKESVDEQALGHPKATLPASGHLGISAEHTDFLNLRQVRQAAEQTAILRCLSIADGNLSATAKLLGVTRPTLYDLIKKYGIRTD